VWHASNLPFYLSNRADLKVAVASMAVGQDQSSELLVANANALNCSTPIGNGVIHQWQSSSSSFAE
jgi:hypothetical protein